MKNMNIIAATTVALSSLSYAGGDIVQSVYENEEVYVPVEEAYVAPVQEEEYVAPVQEEEYVAPVQEEEYVAPVQEEEYVAPVQEEEYVAPVQEEEYVAPVQEEEYVAPAKEEVYVAPVKESVETVTTHEEVIAPAVAAAALGLYGGLGLSAARYETNCNCLAKQKVDKTVGLIGRIGYDINDYIGVEARGIRTNWKPDGGKIKHYGAFLKPQVPMGERANVYGLVGYAKTKTEGYLPKVDADTLALGAGVEYDLAEGPGGLGLFVDYERLVAKKDSPDLDTINFGLTYDF